MAHQAPLVEFYHQHPRTSQPFFLCFGRLCVCVLPAEVLNDAVLVDPDTNEAFSLRTRCSTNDLCYAYVTESCGPDHYWAEVAGTPDLAHTERVLIRQEDMRYALAWDVRLEHKSAAAIRRIIFACAKDKEVHSTRPPSENRSSDDLLPAPANDLVVIETFEVSTDDIEKSFSPDAQNCPQDGASHLVSQSISVPGLQQVLLRTALKKLLQQLAHTRYQAEAWSIQARCAIVAQLKRWQRKTGQRVVNVARAWSEERRSVAWLLIIGAPEFLVVAKERAA
jgi:hypothetical protein